MIPGQKTQAIFQWSILILLHASIKQQAIKCKEPVCDFYKLAPIVADSEDLYGVLCGTEPAHKNYNICDCMVDNRNFRKDFCSPNTNSKMGKNLFLWWFKGESFGLPWMFLQAGNYLLFCIYAPGDIFHYTSRLPDALPDWIWFMFASLFTMCAVISAIMIAIGDATISIRGRKKAKKINQYGSLKRKRNKRSIYRDKY